MKKKIVASTLAVIMAFSGITQAYAAVTTVALGLAGALGDLALQYYLGTQQERSNALTQLNTYWGDTGGSGMIRPVYLSWETLNQMCAELNLNGFPCSIVVYNSSSNTYQIEGNGWVTVPGVIPTTSNHYSIEDKVLHTANGHLHPFVAVAPNDTYSLLNSVYGQIVNIANVCSAISTKVTNTITAITNLVQYIDGIEGYIDTVETKLTDIVTNTSNISTNTGFIDDIYNDVKIGTWVTAYNTYADGSSYPTAVINDQIANNLVAYLNANLMGKEVRYLARDTNNSQLSAVRYFDYAYINASNQIRVRVLYPDGSYQNYYLVSPDHTLIYTSQYKTSNDIYSAIDNISTQISNITGSGNTTNIKTTLIGFGAAIDAQFNGIAQGIANMDANLAAFANLNGTIGSLFSVFGGLFDDLIDSVDASIADLSNLENYTDGIEGLLTNNQTALIKAVDTDGIWLNNNAGTINNMPSVYITSEMANAMITAINSGRAGDYGNFYSSNYTASYQPLISYAYRDPDNNRIRVYARNSSGNNSNMTLVTADGKKYEIVDSPVSNVIDYLHVQIDNVDYTVAQLEALTASNSKEILEWLQGADLSNITAITNLINTYGNNISTTVLRSNKLLQLYNEAFLSHFTDMSDITWEQIFMYFYEFNHGTNIEEVG